MNTDILFDIADYILIERLPCRNVLLIAAPRHRPLNFSSKKSEVHFLVQILTFALHIVLIFILTK